MAHGDDEPLISMAEALRLLDVSSRQFYRLLRPFDERGKPQVPIPSVKVGAQRKFYASEIKAWLRKTNGQDESA